MSKTKTVAHRLYDVWWRCRWHDPGLDEAKKGKLEVEYVPGEELQQLAKKMVSQPRAVVGRVKKLLGKK